jgi:hypothetical protein
VCFVNYIHGVLIHLHVIGNTEAEGAVVTGRHIVSLHSTESNVFFGDLLPCTVLGPDVVPSVSPTP